MRLSALTVTLVCLSYIGVAIAGSRPKPGGPKTTTAALPDCPVAGEPINLAVHVSTKDGPVFFCCKDCIPKYQADPAKYSAKVAAQRKALAARPKVQVACPVSKEAVDPDVYIEHDGRKVYFCCKKCVKKFQQNPDKYKVALANSYSFQTKCPVMGEPINPKASTKLPTGETIYYCCMGCNKKLLADPAKYNGNLTAQGIHVDWAKVKALSGG